MGMGYGNTVTETIRSTPFGVTETITTSNNGMGGFGFGGGFNGGFY
jgi:hypothetical protein